jgi:hypothetical protein
MKVNRFVLFLSAAACAALLGTTPATAGDHIKCYKVKDKVAGSPLKNKWTADLLSNVSPSLDEFGCTISTPASLCCAPVDKVGIAPNPPPVGFSAGPQNKFCCYKVKCPVGPGTLGVSFADQFGTRTLTIPKKPTYVCAPASPSGAFIDSSDLF